MAHDRDYAGNGRSENHWEDLALEYIFQDESARRHDVVLPTADWLPCQGFQDIVDERRLAIALKHGVFFALVVIQFVVGYRSAVPDR